MQSSYARKAKRFALAIAIAAGGPATAAQADELQDLKAQIEAPQKKIAAMEMKQLPQSTPPMGADYAKGLPFLADDSSLTFHGITLYGALDVGVTYQSHGTPLSNSAGLGLEYLISKNSNHSQFTIAPNAMTSSNIGIKGTEEILPGISAIFNLETAFLPTSGHRADGRVDRAKQWRRARLANYQCRLEQKRAGIQQHRLGGPQLAHMGGTHLRSAKRTDLGWCDRL